MEIWIPLVDLDALTASHDIAPEIIGLIAPQTARRLRLLPLDRHNDTVILASDAPEALITRVDRHVGHGWVVEHRLACPELRTIFGPDGASVLRASTEALDRAHARYYPCSEEC